jgi:hypothetical protein
MKIICEIIEYFIRIGYPKPYNQVPDIFFIGEKKFPILNGPFMENFAFKKFQSRGIRSGNYFAHAYYARVMYP